MLGIDVGFGDVKVVWVSDGKFNYLKVPTAIKYDSMNPGFCEDEEETYCFQGRNYLVGENALLDAFSTRSFDFMNRYTGLLIYHILKKTCFNVQNIGVGLPLTWYSKKDEFLKNISNTIVNDEKLNVSPTLFPQAVGILLDHRTDIDGRIIQDTAKDGLVLDIGFNTVDILCFEGGKAIRADSATLEKAGISKIIVELTEYLQQKYNIDLSEQEGKEVYLTRKLKIRSQYIDLSELVRNITEKYFDELLHRLNRWDKRIQRADLMLLGGGGAVLIKDYIPKEYAQLMCVPERPEYSNARGYLKGMITAGGRK
jgi:plasmid segregation protein ParM